jgi:hypothetical protein
VVNVSGVVGDDRTVIRHINDALARQINRREGALARMVA